MPSAIDTPSPQRPAADSSKRSAHVAGLVGVVPAPGATPQSLGPFFLLAARAPRLTRLLGPLIVPLVAAFAPGVRRSTRLNASRIYRRPLSPSAQRAFTRQVLASFYSFITDMALVSRQGRAPHLAQTLVGSVSGEREYRAARARRCGAVLVTAHIGSFEAGLIALRSVEAAVHVVFKRDHSGPFERMRVSLRRALCVHEAAIDDGLGTWLALRDALLRDEVVVMQGDRAVPGQQSATVPFLGGSLRIPTGPVRLARLTSSPIVPVFAIRRADGKHDILLGTPIEPGQSSPVAQPGQIDHTVLAVARAIEAVVARYPHQWLVLDTAFEEDRVA